LTISALRRSVCGAEVTGLLKRIAHVSLIGTLLLALAAPPTDAGGRRGGHAGRHHHGHGRHVVVGVGAWWWGPPYPYWYYPGWYYPPSPEIVVEEPAEYIERAPGPNAYSGITLRAPRRTIRRPPRVPSRGSKCRRGRT